MKTNSETQKTLTGSILSLSLLTVMAGAAVAPALGVIQEYFHGENQLLIQMIISVPALFIFITNLIFPKLCSRMGSRTLVLQGLVLYTVGGIAAGMFNNIWLVLAMRAVVGIGVGIIMPLSTGLLAYYYTQDKLDGLMGWSSAMNQLGGVIATLLSGLLALVSWRASFLVYLLGLISIILCILFLPNERLQSKSGGSSLTNFKQYFPLITAMFLLMMVFFLYPSNFAIVSRTDGSVPQNLIGIIMAGMDVVAAISGALFVVVKKRLDHATRYLAPLLFLAGYLLLSLKPDMIKILLGSACIGFANGIGIPYIIAEASHKVGKSAVSTVLPLMSAALYLSQFVTPFTYTAVKSITLLSDATHLPYYMGTVVSFLFLCWSAVMLREKDV